MEQPDPRNKKIETFFILTQKEKYLKIVLYIYLKKILHTFASQKASITLYL